MLLLKLEKAINRFSDFLGKLSAFLFILLLLNVFFDVIMRYLFNDVSIGMQEMEWHLFATIFLISVPYALYKDGHVRVDIIYADLDYRKRAWIDLIGTAILLLPFTLLVAKFGINFAHESFILGEQSGDPGGLRYRWIVKGVIPFAFASMAISGLGMILKSINILRGVEEATITPEHHGGFLS